MRILLLRLLASLGLAAWYRRANRTRVAVLMYHGVVPDDDPLADGDWLQVRASEFRAQMVELKRHHRVVRLGDLLQPTTEYDQPRAVVTFDDGYANNYLHALPILRELSIPATVFVATGQVGSDRLFWWDRLRLAQPAIDIPAATVAALKVLPPLELEREVDRLLAESGRLPPATPPDNFRALRAEELRALASSGLVDIGSHTHGHEILERLSDAEVIGSLRDSQSALADWGISTRLFAAPNGDYADRQIPLIAGQGFDLCVSTQPGLWAPPEAPYRIPRLDIGRGMAPAEFALMVSGAMVSLKRWRSGSAYAGD